MRRAHASRRGRSAFTLIELLVVIAIIAILISLLLVAVFPIFTRASEADVANEISQLDVAVTTWKTTYKVKFTPPSQLFLCNNAAGYSGNTPAAPQALRTQSLQYLTQIWPRLDWNAGIDWSGGLNKAALDSGVVLQGDQCLVFFLGGIPTQDSNGNLACTGISSNPRNPTQVGGNRIPPQFEFTGARLVQRACTTAAGGTTTVFFSYLDKWGKNQPYVYFSSGKQRGGYNSLGAAFPDTTLGVSPYYNGTINNGATPQYLNPNSCQIISAGRDGAFGAGGQWNPAAGASGAGKDDQSNFSDRPLGVPQ